MLAARTVVIKVYFNLGACYTNIFKIVLGISRACDDDQRKDRLKSEKQRTDLREGMMSGVTDRNMQVQWWS